MLALTKNPIKNPPAEIVNSDKDGYADIEKIKNYFRQLEEEGEDYLHEAKMLIVGEPGAGKTTLAKKIENRSYKLLKKEKSTEGIDITQWMFNMEKGKPFRINIWDFGGQEIQGYRRDVGSCDYWNSAESWASPANRAVRELKSATSVKGHPVLDVGSGATLLTSIGPLC